MTFKTISLVFSIILSLSSTAEMGLFPSEVEALSIDGRQDVTFDDGTWGISANNTLLFNGSEYISRDKEVRFVNKIFKVRSQTTGEDVLYVWFGAADTRFWFGSNQGLYVYSPDRVNTWDHYQAMSTIFDVTHFNGRLYWITYNGSHDSYLVYNAPSKVWDADATERSYTPGVSPVKFINAGDQLFIVGSDRSNGRLNKYEFQGLGRPLLYVSTLNQDKMNIQLQK